MDPEGLPWYARGREIQKVYHGMLESRADREGSSWHAGKQGWIQRVYHGMLEGSSPVVKNTICFLILKY